MRTFWDIKNALEDGHALDAGFIVDIARAAENLERMVEDIERRLDEAKTVVIEKDSE